MDKQQTQTTWLNEEEAAAHLKRSVGTLQQWRHKNKGPRFYRDPHGGIRYSAEDLDLWIRGSAPEEADDD